jgi:hypothetical protein
MQKFLLILSTLTVTFAADVDVQYFFGSRWPGYVYYISYYFILKWFSWLFLFFSRCKAFGSGDFLKVFADFNTTTSFELHPAVRTVGGPCIEESNCNWELATVCAFNQTNIAGQVQFLGCMDEKEGTAKSASKLCAKATGLDEDKIMSCFNGALGQELLKDASAAWNKAFPARAMVPNTKVNGQHVQADYKDLKTAICAAGSTSAACSNKIESDECYA